MTWAGVPTGAANPVVSTDTAVLVHVSPWLASVELAEEDAAPSASPWVRVIDAERAALFAAASTAWCAMAIRPARMMSPTKSRNAGTPITVSMTADPRSEPLRSGRGARRWHGSRVIG